MKPMRMVRLSDRRAPEGLRHSVAADGNRLQLQGFG